MAPFLWGEVRAVKLVFDRRSTAKPDLIFAIEYGFVNCDASGTESRNERLSSS
jgi:hypothetical protein